MDGHGNVRLSLAGAQDKLPVYVEDDRFYLPVGNSPSTHILKFPNRHFKHLPANEVLLSALARQVGLSAPITSFQKIGAEGLCLVERYDRIRDKNDRIVRLHQEDFCQALGLPSSSKYEREGGPAFVDCVHVIREHSQDPLSDVSSLIRWLIFNLLVGNADAHAKNISLVQNELSRGAYRLAPFYDLVCTRMYDRIDRRLAMGIGGEFDPDRVRSPQMRAFANVLDLKARWFSSVAIEMAEKVTRALDDAIASTDLKRSPAIERIVPLVRKQAKRVLRELRA